MTRLRIIVRTPLHPTFGKNNIDDFQPKSSIFFKDDVLLLTGRSLLFFSFQRPEKAPSPLPPTYPYHKLTFNLDDYTKKKYT